MPVNRIQVGGTVPSPDRQDFNLVAGTGISLTAADDSTNNVSKVTIAVSGAATETTLTATVSVLTPLVDANVAGPYAIAPLTATSIPIGSATVAPSFPGGISVGAGKSIAGGSGLTVSTSAGALTANGFGGINLQINGTTIADVGVSSAAAVSLAAGKNLTVTSGATALTGAVGGAAPLAVTGAIQTSGATGLLTVTGAASTAQTATTEINFVNLALNQSVQWATGSVTTQRCVLVQPPTITAVAASTFTNAATLAISGAPVQGTNATLTNTMALWVQGGAVNLGQATVSQATNINTGVTINGASGVITTQSASTGTRAAEAGFTVTNNAVLAGSSVIAKVVGYSGTMFTNGQPDVDVTAVAAGSFNIRVINRDATNALSGTMKIHFSVT